MPIESHILGTSSARPTSSRAVSGSVVVTDEGNFVVDAGEGFQTRFQHQRKHLKHIDQKSSIRPSKIKAIFLTHGHLDHTWGVLPWLQSLSLDGRTQPLVVIGPTSPKVIEALIESTALPADVPAVDLVHQCRYWMSMVNSDHALSYDVSYVLGDPHTQQWVQLLPEGSAKVLSTSLSEFLGLQDVEVEAFGTIHSVPSCAWSFLQKERLGSFDRQRAAALKLSDAQRTDLASGIDVEHEGTLLIASSFRGPSRPALRLVISGDTAEMSPSLCSLQDCNALIHEATFVDEQQEQANTFLHSTARGAMRTAKQMNARHLCLTHYSNRLSDTELSISQALSEHADIVVTAANDYDRIRVEDSGDVVHKCWDGNGWSQ